MLLLTLPNSVQHKPHCKNANNFECRFKKVSATSYGEESGITHSKQQI